VRRRVAASVGGMSPLEEKEGEERSADMRQRINGRKELLQPSDHVVMKFWWDASGTAVSRVIAHLEGDEKRGEEKSEEGTTEGLTTGGKMTVVPLIGALIIEGVTRGNVVEALVDLQEGVRGLQRSGFDAKWTWMQTGTVVDHEPQRIDVEMIDAQHQRLVVPPER
jgi:hypothetical protein